MKIWSKERTVFNNFQRGTTVQWRIGNAVKNLDNGFRVSKSPELAKRHEGSVLSQRIRKKDGRDSKEQAGSFEATGVATRVAVLVAAKGRSEKPASFGQ
jgi:hypothetical protein